MSDLDNTFQSVNLFINKKEVLSKVSGNISFAGSNQLNSLTVTIENPDLQNSALYNKPIELYLNDGSIDSVPIFRGFIKSLTPSEKKITLTATDVRSLLQGNDGLKITLTDEKNYDGFTIGQFLHSLIDDERGSVKKYSDNEDLWYIKTDNLKDTDPPVFMTGVRGENLSVYEIVSNKVSESIDNTTDFNNPLGWFIDVKEDSNYSNITFVKEKLHKSHDFFEMGTHALPKLTFSWDDGLLDYKYKRRIPPNTAHYKGGVFRYTNRPKGQVNTAVEDLGSPAETKNLAIQKVLLENQSTDEISITVSKGFFTALGDIILLDIDDEDIGGKHRVQSKTITFGSSCTCTLQLNKAPIKLKSFI